MLALEPLQAYGIMSSRGCPYSCSFCSSAAMWRSVRYHSPEYVVAEMREIYENYHPVDIGFNDDLFAINKKRLREIAALMKGEEFFGRVRIQCLARANLMDDETAKLLKGMNCNAVMLGLESGCPRTLKYLKGPSVSVEDNTRAINVLTDNGVEAEGSFIVGSPGETKEEMLETLGFIKKSRLSWFQVGQMLPFPGTQVWEEFKAKGIVSEDMDWGLYDYPGGSCMSDPRLNGSTMAYGALKDEVFEPFLKERIRRLRHKVLLFSIKDPRYGWAFVKRKVGLWRKFRAMEGGA